MFGGHGTLHTFSSKIDLARAIGTIGPLESRYLHAIREIRNAFAHADDEEINFEHETILQLCKKLPNKRDSSMPVLTQFFGACIICLEMLEKKKEKYQKASKVPE
jgi:hypothetical protein